MPDTIDRCPDCNAPLKHYTNSDRSSTDYCEYCNYRKDYPAPEASIGSQVIGLIGGVLGVQTRPEVAESWIERMDKEKARLKEISQMPDKERSKYLKKEAKAKLSKLLDS